MLDWLSNNEQWVALFGGLSLIAFVGSLILVPLIILSLPIDFFTRQSNCNPRVGIGRLCWRAAKNLAGALFVLSGVLMLVLPGQGILSLLIGFSLIDFPAKRRLQVRLIRLPRVQRMVNWIRLKGKREPLEIPPAWEG